MENTSKLILSDQVIEKLRRADVAKTKNAQLTGAEALLVWQYIRFNKRYQKSYAALGFESKKSNSETERWELARKWGLSEALDYRQDDLPGGFHIQKISTVYVDFSNESYDEESERELQSTVATMRLQQPRGSNSGPLVLAIDRSSDIKRVLKEIERKLRDDRIGFLARPWDPPRIKGSAAGNIASNLLCYYLKVIRRLTTEQISKELEDRLGDHITLQPHSLKKRIETFKNWSNESPWVFFNEFN